MVLADIYVRMLMDGLSKKYLNRELSVLEFNARVLAEAEDNSNPILERLKFLGIVSSNLDEFFMVRMASLKSAENDLSEISARASSLMDEMNQYFLNHIIPELEKAGIHRIKSQVLNDKQMNYVKRFFDKELFPLLTPVAIHEGMPFPVLNNLHLYLIACLQDQSADKSRKYAVVEVPAHFPRMIYLAESAGYSFIMLEDVISLFLGELFHGFEILDRGIMRLTRGAELTLDEEKDEDFSKVMAEALRLRRNASVVRLEIDAAETLIGFLKENMAISEEAVYLHKSWFDLKSVSQLAFQPGFEELKRPVWIPRSVPAFEKEDDVWKLIRENNIYVVHPYQSFDVVTRFIHAAAEDPDVLAIKQTLYRTGGNSPVIDALEKAAQNGKQVTVLVELKARFDEERNIEGAKRLESAGANVLYGIAGYKTHAKVCLVIRREPEGIRRYVHLSTGNYNDKTARLYSDIGFFTSDEDFAKDVSAFFNMITGYSQPLPWSKIEVAPFGLKNRLIRCIIREAMRSSKERPGLIMAKMNSLADTEVIDALYKASQQNVQIKLNIRGICCLKPGVPGLSENIEVVSVVDMFLEHSRMIYFENGGEDELFLSSADWMPRNLDRRIELMFPIQDKESKRSLIEMLKLYFKDNVKAWHLGPDGKYEKIEPDARKRFRVQEYLCKKAAEEEAAAEKSFRVEKDLKPQKPIHSHG